MPTSTITDPISLDEESSELFIKALEASEKYSAPIDPALEALFLNTPEEIYEFLKGTNFDKSANKEANNK